MSLVYDAWWGYSGGGQEESKSEAAEKSQKKNMLANSECINLVKG